MMYDDNDMIYITYYLYYSTVLRQGSMPIRDVTALTHRLLVTDNSWNSGLF